MIFSELYGAYYNAVAKILAEAVKAPISADTMRRLIAENAFGESALRVEPALTGGDWRLLLPNGETPLTHAPTMPLTLLQRRWLKAISLDPRIRLFPAAPPEDPDVEPLFTPGDVVFYDRYADGDPYEDEGYIRRFRLILHAIHTGTPLALEVRNRFGEIARLTLLPKTLEYSEKDDKFRVIGSGGRRGRVVNLARIVRCEPYAGVFDANAEGGRRQETREVVLELVDERNALERALLHFAHLEKEVEQLDETRYRVTLRYDKDDETELVIRVLSFGPMLRVIGPPRFEALIKERLFKQKNCGLS